MRRSRRKGQLRRVSSINPKSISPNRISSASCEALAMTRPNGSARKLPPQNSMPGPVSRRSPYHFAMFNSNAIDCGHIDTVGDGVSPLNGLPRIVLRGAELVLFRRMPADGRGIKQHLRALQRCQAGGFGIPLVPADQRAHTPKGRVTA